MSIFDNEIFEESCPGCGKIIKKKVSWFKINNQVCPFGCGTTFETKTFRKRLEEQEKAFNNFAKSLKNLKF